MPSESEFLIQFDVSDPDAPKLVDVVRVDGVRPTLPDTIPRAGSNGGNAPDASSREA